MLNQRQFDQILGQVKELVFSFGDLAEALQEAVAAKGRNVELKGHED